MNSFTIIDNSSLFVEVYKTGNISKLAWDKIHSTVTITIGNTSISVGSDDLDISIEKYVENLREFLKEKKTTIKSK